MELADLLKQVKEIIISAGRECLKFYDAEYSLELSKEEFPVTQADAVSDKVIIQRLKAISHFPILTEESRLADSQLKSKQLWIVDPLDGTKDFMEKNGEFCVMIALWDSGQIKLGLVYQPTTAKLYYAVSGQGAYLEQNKQSIKLQVSKEGDLNKRTMLLSRHHPSPVDNEFKNQAGLVLTRPYGSAGLKLALLAEGEAHFYLNASPNTGEWDIAAGKVILEEAGGKITDIYGQELLFNKPEPFNRQGFIASTNVDHRRLIEILSHCL